MNPRSFSVATKDDMNTFGLSPVTNEVSTLLLGPVTGVNVVTILYACSKSKFVIDTSTLAWKETIVSLSKTLIFLEEFVSESISDTVIVWGTSVLFSKRPMVNTVDL